jgi:hypothetical protein
MSDLRNTYEWIREKKQILFALIPQGHRYSLESKCRKGTTKYQSLCWS